MNVIHHRKFLGMSVHEKYLTGTRRLLAPTKYCATVIKRWLRLAKSVSSCMLSPVIRARISASSSFPAFLQLNVFLSVEAESCSD